MKPIAALLAAACLAGCAHAPPAIDDLDVDARRARLRALPGWDMRGRLAVDTGERAFQARFRWHQEGETLRLNVRGPFGAGSFEIAGDDAALTLRTRGERWQLVDPEAELSALFGWWMPVGSLDSWLLGLPDEAFESDARTDRAGRLVALEQRLWTLEFDDYRLASGVALPGTISLRHGPLTMRLTIDDWEPAVAPQRALNSTVLQPQNSARSSGWGVAKR